MNKLNKKIISFVLLFSICLLVNVSYAFVFEPGLDYSTYGYNVDFSTPNSANGYTLASIKALLTNYISEPSLYELEFNALLEAFGYSDYVFLKINSSASPYMLVLFNSSEVDVAYNSTKKYFTIGHDSEGSVYTLPSGNSYINYNQFKDNGKLDYSFESIYHSTCSIKLMPNYVWDGESYYYKAETDEPEESIMPTNSEIASVVQSFYDSDLYKNNTNFKDFMVVYSFATGNYSIIGTDNHLLQEIYYDGAKPSNEDFSYPDTWWRFYNYFGNVQNFFYGWDYWLYSTRKENDVFLPLEYNGVGKINDLFELKFSTQSIIVYSSYEYKVYEFYPPEIEGDSNQVTETTVPGDEYTYNEELNPTDSEYSPIQNYIPANPSQTILGDVDFDEINKTFEENKDILNIEGASWLFTANNKLVGYFIGFLSLLIIFLIISRILGG